MDGSTKVEKGGVAGRTALMEAIVAEHETALLRYATRILNDTASAQDVVQNTFIKLFRSWEEGTQPSKQLKAWLYRVTHNEAIDYVRRESRLRVLHEKHAEAKLSEDCPDGIHCGTPEEERRQLVLRHMRRLDPREQQVLLLRLEEGLPYAAIAQVTGRTEGNVGNILHHAVRKLAESLKREQLLEEAMVSRHAGVSP